MLFSAASCVVRAVRKFDCRILRNETPNKRRPLERRSYSDTIYTFSPDPRECYKTPIHTVQVNCVLFRDFTTFLDLLISIVT
jgi:hypothetical protein